LFKRSGATAVLTQDYRSEISIAEELVFEIYVPFQSFSGQMPPILPNPPPQSPPNRNAAKQHLQDDSGAAPAKNERTPPV